MDKNAKIYVAGHRGLVGSAIIRNLEANGYHNLIMRTHNELDLTNQQAVDVFFKQEKPEYVFLAAAKVGGIHANNTYPAEFIYKNLMIEANVINASYENDVKRLLLLGSSCIYPKFANQPIQETELLTGILEPSNEPYAIAKIAGIKLCESYNRQYDTDYRSVMPTNLYGQNDNFHPEDSHVIPALIARFHRAKLENTPSVVIWGTGTPQREFLHVDDMAAACVHVLSLSKDVYEGQIKSQQSHINVGTGKDITIRELAELIAEVVGFTGEIELDTKKPDGAPRKLLDVTKLNNLGWKATIDLKEGLLSTYEWFVENYPSGDSKTKL
jgi:GDP-L-fucose synthase